MKGKIVCNIELNKIALTMEKSKLILILQKISLSLGTLLILISYNTTTYSQADSLFNLSFEDLMKIPIISAGKQEQTIAEIPASTVVILRKEIEVIRGPMAVMYGNNAFFGVINIIP